MQWTQPLPNWIRTLFVLFGLAAVVVAFVDFSGMTLGGIVVGAVWALVGWKGLPVIRTTDVQEIRRRRIAAIVAAPVWLLVASLTLPRVPQPYIDTAFFVSAIPAVFFVFRFGLSACPRCGRHFFLSKHFVGSWVSKCKHCGLSLRGDSTAIM